MTGNDVETFRQGASYYRNARDWAKEQREEAIRQAHQRVGERQARSLTIETSLERISTCASETTVEEGSRPSEESRDLQDDASNTTAVFQDSVVLAMSSRQKRYPSTTQINTRSQQAGIRGSDAMLAPTHSRVRSQSLRKAKSFREQQRQALNSIGLLRVMTLLPPTSKYLSVPTILHPLLPIFVQGDTLQSPPMAL